MPLYTIAAPNGKTYSIEGPEGATREEVIAAILARDPNADKPPSGGIGTPMQFLRGLPAGGVGLLEQAAIGASSVLPERAEQAVRPYIKSAAEAIRAPFAEAPGREDTIARRLGESVGSVGAMIPLAAMGPLGLAGAAGLGVAAGAGEARTRAEAGGATDAERATATGAGAIVGATEMLPIARFLRRLGTGGTGVVNTLRRALVTGGEEGLQEAAANIAQNLIERGIYNPEKGVFTDTGEALGYGAGTGALVSALADVVLGGRRRGAGAAPPSPVPETPPTAPTAPPAPAALDTLSDTDMLLEAIRLREIPAKQRTAEEATRLKQIDALTAQRIQRQRDITAYDAARAEQSAFAQPTPTQVEQRATMLMPYEERALQQPQEEAAAPEETEAVPPSEQLELPGVTPVSQIVTPEVLAEAGLPVEPKTLKQKAAARWMQENVVGKSYDEVRDLVEKNPDLIKGRELPARILRDLITSAPAPFEGEQIERAEEPAEPVAGGREPSMAVPREVGAVGLEPAAPGQPEAPVASGVEPAERTVAPGVGPEGAQPTAIAQPPTVTAQALQPFVAPDRATPQAANVLARYAARMGADRASPEDLPRYMGWDLMNGSTVDPQTGEFTKIDLRPGKDAGITAPQARAAFEALTPQAQQQVLQEARNYVAQEAQADIARERMDRQQAMQAPETVDLEGLSEDYGLDVLAERAGRRPTVTETPTGRRVQGTRYQEGAPTNAEPLSAPVLEALRKGDLSTALLQLSEENHPPLFRALAARLSPLLVNTRVTIVTDMRDGDGEPVAGSSTTSGLAVQLDDVRGLNVETLLHESVHAGSERIIATPAAQRTAQQNVAMRELNALWEAAKADPDMVLGTAARKNLSEFVTEALTNPDTIKQLQVRPWKRDTLWNGFKRTLLRMLGMGDPQTMAEATITSMDTIFARPMRVEADSVRYQASPQQPLTAQQALDELRNQPAQQRSLRAMINGAFGGPGRGAPGANNDYVISTTAKLRTRLSDKAATVFEALDDAVTRGMLSAMSAKSTQVAFKQAEASDQLTPEFMRRGAIERDTVGGWQAAQVAGIRAPVEVFGIIANWGKARGLPMEQAWTDAARLMESGRQYVFREHNRKAKPGEPRLPVSMTDAQIDALYPAYKADPALLEAKKILDDARIRLIDQMVEVGRLSKDMAQEWKAAAEYIPFDRLSDEALGRYEAAFRKQKRTGAGLTALGNLPTLVDKSWVDRPVGNALENYFGTLGWMQQQVMRTDALNKTLEQLESIKQADKAGRTPPTGVPYVKTYQGGYPVYYTVPTIYHAFAFNAQIAPLPKYMQVLGQISRILRTSITALPTFPASQLPQDIQRAIAYSGVQNPAALSAKALANFKDLGKHALKGTLSTATPDLSASGVAGDVDFRANDPARSLLEEFGYASPTQLKSKTAGKILHRLNEISRASDIAIRKAIYDQTMEETNDRLLALQRAREIINFRTTGAGDPLNILPSMIQTIPFFNAYVQGTDVLYRALTGKGAVSGLARRQALKKFYTVAGTVTAGSMMYALMMAGDEEYENMALDKRDRTWVLGGGFSIPVPSEIGMIFKAIPERVVDAYMKYGTPDETAGMTAITSWFRAAAIEYGNRLNPTPAALRPVYEAWTNYSMRTWRELEGAYQEGLVPSERVTSATSDFAREVARFAKATLGMEISPIKIDNTLNGYFGTTAALTLATMDAMTSDRADRPLHRIVGLTPFTYDPVGTRRINEFYDMREKVVQAQNTLNTLMKQNPEAAYRFAEKNADLLTVYKAVNATLKQLQDTRNYKNWLDTSAAAEQYSGEERLRLKQEVQKWEQGLVGWVREARKELNL